MHKSVVLFFIAILLLACNNGTVYGEYQSVKGSWEMDEIIDFSFQAPDSLNSYNIFLNLRNDNDYPFSNLFLIVNLDFPDGKTVSDTLEYEMAKPNGEWLGKGFSSVKENKLLYKEKVVFPNMGDYHIAVEHAMRKNGEINGVSSLKGITDVGISIEKTANE
ncbi:gliding motility lipoprotein GldH [Galbibacter mesophilus]|uniref:gliding motility lipoprotein GldH n=1 Tax=Galbibacter mesophilus TaxID=379069 RepID=UPI00191DE012|nr:gliding motility lipoprotein GldH [Galbibacter mesophilus]MCM5662189.1 gliding motility lipoprotein GldH [Galbibacter mesophilus]